MEDVQSRYVGAHEIRDMLGVSRQRVYQLAGQPSFPRPVATLAQGKIWLTADVQAWISTYRSTPRARRANPTPAPSSEPTDQLQTQKQPDPELTRQDT